MYRTLGICCLLLAVSSGARAAPEVRAVERQAVVAPSLVQWLAPNYGIVEGESDPVAYEPFLQDVAGELDRRSNHVFSLELRSYDGETSEAVFDLVLWGLPASCVIREVVTGGQRVQLHGDLLLDVPGTGEFALGGTVEFAREGRFLRLAWHPSEGNFVKVPPINAALRFFDPEETGDGGQSGRSSDLFGDTAHEPEEGVPDPDAQMGRVCQCTEDNGNTCVWDDCKHNSLCRGSASPRGICAFYQDCGTGTKRAVEVALIPIGWVKWMRRRRRVR